MINSDSLFEVYFETEEPWSSYEHCLSFFGLGEICHSLVIKGRENDSATGFVKFHWQYSVANNL